jgi:general secretion pathway protein N
MNVRIARLTTTALAAACGFLVLTGLAQYIGVGRGYRWSPDDPDSAPTLPGGTINDKPLQFPPATAFSEVETHPLFNEDRKPTPIDASAGDDSAAPQNPLNIALTGIVSTSSVKIAMVQDKARNQSVALKVGMPLEGDQASWTLVEVKPRSVVFQSAANERTEVELTTAIAPPPPPPRSTPRSQPRPPGGAALPNRGNPPAKDNKAGRTDSSDLAKRIEERRRQMREDAEKQRNQAGGKGKPPPAPPKK